MGWTVYERLFSFCYVFQCQDVSLVFFAFNLFIVCYDIAYYCVKFEKSRVFLPVLLPVALRAKWNVVPEISLQ